MVGIYLSGTGNTKHCIEKLVKILDNSAKTLPLESENVVDEIRKNDIIIIGYPTQFSNAPYMVRDFIISHAEIWDGKKVLCVATMGAFSGDGAGCTARLLKKQGAAILGGLHIHMPDSVCDSKLLKKRWKKTKESFTKLIKKSKRQHRIFKTENILKMGLVFSHISLVYLVNDCGFTEKQVITLINLKSVANALAVVYAAKSVQ